LFSYCFHRACLALLYFVCHTAQPSHACMFACTAHCGERKTSRLPVAVPCPQESNLLSWLRGCRFFCMFALFVVYTFKQRMKAYMNTKIPLLSNETPETTPGDSNHLQIQEFLSYCRVKYHRQSNSAIRVGDRHLKDVPKLTPIAASAGS